MTEWNKESAKAHLIDLVKEMMKIETTMAVDTKGDCWVLGRWYGGPLHFRKNLGHWSEEVFKYTESWCWHRLPMKPYKPNLDHLTQKELEESAAWAEFYQRPIGGDDV